MIKYIHRMFKSGILVLVLAAFLLFVLPVIPERLSPIFYPITFTAIFLAAAFSVEKARKFHVTAAVTLSIVSLIGMVASLEWMQFVSRSLQIIYFIIVVVALVTEIASSKVVDKEVIINAISAYFLLGMALCLVATLVAVVVPDAYNIEVGSITYAQRYNSVREMTYYTFITYTTTGYGEIVPMKPASRSLAIVIASCGQLYIATIIAMLVGKYSASKN